MAYSVAPLEELVEQFARLPGIGRKTAQRLAMYVLTEQTDLAQKFAVSELQRFGYDLPL